MDRSRRANRSHLVIAGAPAFGFGLRPPLFDRLQNFRDRFVARFRAEIAFAVDADANGVGFQVAFADDEHGVDFHLLGPLDFAVDLVGAFVDLRADLMSAQFVQNRSRVID